MINSVNQKKLKMSNAKNNEHSTKDSIRAKSNRNTGISTYSSIITINVMRLNFLTKVRDCLIESKWMKLNNPLCTRSTPNNQRHTQAKSGQLEKDTLGMHKLKAIRSIYSHIRRSRF
jgi:hypothetical protein